MELLDHMVEITPCMCGQSIYDEGGKRMQWEKDSHFSKWCKLLKIIDLYVKGETAKLLEENTVEYHHGLFS